ncbi:MAG: phosphate uptake regulator PhoU [Candidatus Nanohaloarchaea archaeon]|nr:phosphate uptake regulator PhoU [Candidatus Nanohaloarchaea archaeon]
MDDRTTRKVQQVGGGTLTVSLPKDWARVMDVDAGDEVVFERNRDGTLTLSPVGEPEEAGQSCVIDADSCDNTLLARCIVGGYILGYETIEITADTIDQELLTVIHRTMRRLNGISIIEQTDDAVTLRNFVDPSDASVYVIMRRMSSTVLHMLDSSLYALLQGREDLFQEVREMEDDIDVLYWLVLRQLLSAVENENVMDEIGVDNRLHLVGNRTAIKSLEGMADCIEAIVDDVEALVIDEGVTLTTSQQEQLSEISESVHAHISNAIEALIDQDVEQANRVLVEKERFPEETEHLLDALREDYEDVDTNLAFNRIAWNLQRLVEYAGFIAEITVNRGLEQVTEDEGPIQDTSQ